MTSVRFQYTVDVASGTFDDDTVTLQPVQIETSGGTQLATVSASGTLQSGTTSVAIDLTDNSPSTSHNATDWSGAVFDGVTSQIIAQYNANMKADGVAVQILSSSVTITITYNTGTPSGSFTQTTARAYEDGGEASGASYSSGEITGGANPTLDAWPNGKTYLARFEIEETASVSEDFQAQLEYSHNSGAWTSVTTSSSVVKAVPSSTIFDGDATTNRISSSAKTFQAGLYSDDGLSGTVTGLNNEHTEFLFSFVIVYADVSDADTINLRVTNNTTPEVTTWTDDLGITVNKETPTLPGVVHNEWSGVSGETWGWFGPHCDSNGNLYYFTEVGFWKGESSGQSLPHGIAWKSSDGGKSWQVTDMDGRPGQGNWADLEGMDVARSHLGPDTTGELWLGKQSDSAGDMYVVQFRTSDHATNADTWGSVTNRAYTTIAEEDYGNIIERSDGDLVVVYGQNISSTDRVVFDWQSGGTWQGQSSSALDLGTNNYSYAKASLGNSDRIVVVMYDRTSNSLDVRNLPDNTATPGNTTAAIEGAQTVKNYSSGVMVAGPIVGVLQYDSTNDKHLVIWQDNSDILRSVTLTWNSGTSTYDAGTPEQVSTTTADHDFPTGADTTGVCASMAVDYDTGDVFCTWIDPTNRAIHYAKWDSSSGWGSTTTLYTPSGDTDRAMYVMPSVFTHASGNGGAKVLGYVYTLTDITSGEGSYLDREALYNEVTLTGGTNATVDLTTDGAVDAVSAVVRPGVDIVELPATVNATGDLPGAALDITITSLLPNIGTGAIPAPTVETGSPHTEEAVTINGVAAIPTVAVGITEEAATVTATVGFGTFTVSTDSELPSPATLNTIAGIPATVEVGITEDAVTVDAAAGFGTSTISTDSDLPSPTSITAPVAVGDETLSLTSDLPAPTTINTISSIGTETVTADSTLTPATLNTTTAIPAPTVDTTGTANPQPDTLNATTTIPQPAASITEDAATLNAIAAVPAPTVDVGGDAERTPATINNPAGIPATTPATDSNLPTPATVNATTTIPAPTVDTTTPANPTPATLNTSAALPAPTISGDTAPAPTSLPATGAVPSPTITTTGDATRTPNTITTTTSIPTTTNDLDYIFTVESIPAYVDTITATITAGSGDADFWLAFTSEPTHTSGFSSTSDVTFTMQMERNEG